MKTRTRQYFLGAVILAAIASAFVWQYFSEIKDKVYALSLARNAKAVETLCPHLPRIYRIEVLSLNKVKANGDEGFYIRPYKIMCAIKGKAVVEGDAAEAIAKKWRSLPLGGLVAAGHDPDVALKFYDKNGRLILDTTISWTTQNFWIPSGWSDYVWVPFQASSEQAISLRVLLNSVLRERAETTVP